MKKRYLLLFLLLPAICLADIDTWNGQSITQDTDLIGAKNANAGLSAIDGATIVSGACTTAHTTNTGAQTGDIDVHDDADRYLAGHHLYDPGSNVSVCKVTFYLSSTGTVSGKTYYLDIYTTPFSALVSLQGTSASVTGDNSWNDTAVEFTFSSSVSLTSGTLYGFALRNTDGSPDASNFVDVGTVSGSVSGSVAQWSSGLARTGTSATDVKMIITVE